MERPRQYRADRAGLDMRVVTLPTGKDPDEAARENPAALRKAIKEAVPIYDYFITSAAKRFDVATAFGKKKIGEELAPVLAKIENPIVQGHYIKKLAGTIDATEEAIDQMVRRSARGIPAAEADRICFLIFRSEPVGDFLILLGFGESSVGSPIGVLRFFILQDTEEREQLLFSSCNFLS